jgi:hypothetical protein
MDQLSVRVSPEIGMRPELWYVDVAPSLRPRVVEAPAPLAGI